MRWCGPKLLLLVRCAPSTCILPTPAINLLSPCGRRLDPPFNYFRIRLVCTLLETCGQYFTKARRPAGWHKAVLKHAKMAAGQPPGHLSDKSTGPSLAMGA